MILRTPGRRTRLSAAVAALALAALAATTGSPASG